MSLNQLEEKYYLKSSIRLEPYNWGWYAWPQLICPTTAAFNILNRNLKLMESFVAMPEIHKLAAIDPSLMGGSFVNLDESSVPAVQQLIDETKENCQELLQLADAITQTDELLRTHADGHSLENLYPLVPDCLKGRVELVYDANNHPTIRFIEALIYDKFYKEDGQAILISDTTQDYRPFVLSTPKILHHDECKLNLPFSDERIDVLAKLRFEAMPLNKIYDLFTQDITQQMILKEMLTKTPPYLDKARNYQGDNVRVRYFGHACILLETNNTRILIDPVVSYQYRSDTSRFTLNDLPDSIDYVLFTHIHDDHVLFETLFQLRYKVKNFVIPRNNKGFLLDPSLKLILKKVGFKNLIDFDEFEELNFIDGQIVGVPFFGEHCDLNIQTKMAYFIKLNKTSFLFAADSNNLESELYQNIFQKLGKVDAFFIGMECVGAPLTWLYGPLLTYEIKNSHNQSRRLSGSNFGKAWEIVKMSQSSHVYVYAMGQEPWLNYIMALEYSDQSIQIAESNKLIEKCQENGIISERLFLKKEWYFK
ncbi:MAG TPA: MBL fold metallo-hydrolase [Gammaproteobacteria bacterium]|jgi:L-ascorbate metabolism protein UlaG (beta-lactamase superfamily)|nr:MBL fold metallo-hydrolase [Gammaproteobacteria bacterium]